ncbi:MAG: glycosyltransferase [Planctomycetota bacterium]
MAVAHAGMGTILKALEMGKPVLIMPRRASPGEQRNEHQLATAERFERLGIVQVAQDEIDLARRLESLDSVQASKRISDSASPELISHLRAFLARHLGEV